MHPRPEKQVADSATAFLPDTSGYNTYNSSIIKLLLYEGVKGVFEIIYLKLLFCNLAVPVVI